MKVRIHMVNGDTITIENVDDHDTIMPMVEALSNDEAKVLTFVLDDGVTYIVKRNVVRIDVD